MFAGCLYDPTLWRFSRQIQLRGYTQCSYTFLEILYMSSGLSEIHDEEQRQQQQEKKCIGGKGMFEIISLVGSHCILNLDNLSKYTDG